jgi:hypothetical protein
MYHPYYIHTLTGTEVIGTGEKSNLQQKWISIACYNVGHTFGHVDGTKTTDYLWAAMTDAVQTRITLGNVPEYIASVTEIYEEA